MTKSSKTIILFDIDGTLTKPRQVISPEMLKFLVDEIMPVFSVGLVGGSDLPKITEQMSGEDVIKKFDYTFAENGLLALNKNVEIGRESIQAFMGEDKIQKFINFCLKYMSEIQLPVKRGTFVEFRNGLINICPVGRSCSQAERDQFFLYDKEHKIREKFIAEIERRFPDIGFKYSIGGQISFDVFPVGWDKTYCLKFLDQFETVHFFGDKTFEGGNDYEIFHHARTVGHTTTGPENTMQQLKLLLKSS